MISLDFSAIVFLFLIFVVAFLYSSVGHGGASGYLALMGIYHMSPAVMRPSALLMNIVVSAIAFAQYSRNRTLDTKLFLLLAFGSVPSTFIGAGISLDASIYERILSLVLVLPAMRLLLSSQKDNPVLREPNSALAVFMGIAIGLLSGMIGIGGGIILSPLLLMLGWANTKEVALMSALFILVNSTAGMAGLVSKGFTFESTTYLWVCVAVAGGVCGGYLGSRKYNVVTIRRILGIVMLIASAKLFLQSMR